LALAHSPADFLSTTQIAITVITILAGALGEATLSSRLADSLSEFAWLRPYANGLGFWMVVVGVAVCALVLGELVPKRLALINPEGVASATARPMQLLSKAMSPLVRLMSLATELVLRLLGARVSGQPPVTEEEINVLMEQGAEAGVFEKHEQAIVSRVFRLDDEPIANVMTPRGDIIYFDLGEPFEVNREKLLRSRHSRFVICRGGLHDVVGILRAKTLVDAAFEGKPPRRLSGLPLQISRRLILVAFAMPSASTMLSYRPAAKQALDSSRLSCSFQLLSKCLLRKHLRDRRQDPQVLLVGVLGNQDHEEGRHWLMIRRTKRYWVLGTRKQHHRGDNARNTGVWNRDPVSNSRRSTLLPSP
jgi:CBS domain containing-hemolysin-like protein